jgi:hypothetical protein
MNWSEIIVGGLIALIVGMQLLMWIRAKRSVGQAAPDTSSIDGAAAADNRRLYYFYSAPIASQPHPRRRLAEPRPLPQIRHRRHAELHPGFGRRNPRGLAWRPNRAKTARPFGGRREGIQMIKIGIAAMLVCAAAVARADDRGMTIVASPFDMDQTVERVESALTAKGVKIFAVVDHAAEAKAV